MDSRQFVGASARPHLAPQPWYKPIAHLARKHQLVAFSVVADHERLRFSSFVLERCAGSLADLATGVAPLCDHAFKAELFHQRD